MFLHYGLFCVGSYHDCFVVLEYDEDWEKEPRQEPT